MTHLSPTGSLEKDLERAALELTLAYEALAEAAHFVQAQAQVPPGVGINRASEDPHVILRFGQLRARLHAAEGLLARAVRVAKDNNQPVPATAAVLHAAAEPSPATPLAAAARPRAPIDAAAGIVSLLETRAFITDLIAEITGQLAAWGGPPVAAQQRRDTHGETHQPANHWNYHYAGNYYLKGVVPPRPETQP
jgi:alkylation response protein AidB-like acyl-CoA dehydrogenase